MPDCHKCKHRDAVEAGRYANTPYAKTPCGKCAGPAETSHHGKSHVSLDATADGGEALLDRRERVYTSDLERDVGADATEAMRDWARRWMALDGHSRRVALARLIAPDAPVPRQGGRTRQAEHRALQRAREAIPGLALVTGTRKG